MPDGSGLHTFASHKSQATILTPQNETQGYVYILEDFPIDFRHEIRIYQL